MNIPLDILVDVLKRQFPLDGEMHEVFSNDIDDDGINITINDEEFVFELAGDNINSAYINPEIR